MKIQGQIADYFPRGMHQPENGFRFSADSLLLSSFTHPPSKGRIMDMGCGCGVIGIALLLKHEDKELTVHAVDVQTEMVDCTQMNAQKFQVTDRLNSWSMDLETEYLKIVPESYDLVTANPPYFTPGKGRKPQNAEQGIASFGNGYPDSAETLDIFLSAARRALKNKGALYFLFSPERLQSALLCMEEHRIRTKRLCFVHGHKEKQSKLVLIKGVKNGSVGGCRLEPPLILYAGNTLTEQARQFCPFLACNPKR